MGRGIMDLFTTEEWLSIKRIGSAAIERHLVDKEEREKREAEQKARMIEEIKNMQPVVMKDEGGVVFLSPDISEAERDKEMARLDKQERQENMERHHNSPFYAKAQDYWLATQRGQIDKGAAKYPEPFNPDSWTAKELADHAMQENVDQAHYITGLLHKLEMAEIERINQLHEIGRIKSVAQSHKDQADFHRSQAEGWESEYRRLQRKEKGQGK